MDMDELLAGAAAIVLMVLVIAASVIAINGTNVWFSPNVSVYVDGKNVHNGSSACILIKTAGFNTKVSVYGGSLCLLPKAFYVSKDVVVKPMEAKDE